MMNEIILQTENLRVGIPKKKKPLFYAVDGINLRISKGETLALVGESGSGKSMTAMAIMGLLTSWNSRLHPVMEGKILYHGRNGEQRDLLKITPEEYDHYRGNEIGMIFQEPLTTLNPVLTVGHQIRESILAHEKISIEEADRHVIQLMGEVGIPDPQIRFRQYPHQFSGGQIQRIVIAMAIACGCRLLIADEPTTALDVTIQRQILNLLKKLQKENQMGILLITHDFGVVSETADRVAVMYSGKIVETGGVDQIFSRPEHPYTRMLIASIPTLNTLPGAHLLTREDFMADGSRLFNGLSFDPESRDRADVIAIEEEHYMSTVFTGGKYERTAS